MTAPKPLDLESWCQERAERFWQHEQIEMATFPSPGYRDIALVEWTVRTLGNPELPESREVLGILAERHPAPAVATREPLYLDEIEARANAASAAPWTTGGDGLVWAPRLGDPVSGSTEMEDAEFIADARTTVPRLVAEVRALQTANERLQAMHREALERNAPLTGELRDLRARLESTIAPLVNPLDLDAIEAKWLQQCAVHDAGIPGSCPCPDSDHRPVIAGLVAEIQALRVKLAGPCGSCHPCMNYADETWRAAGRKPPHVITWEDTRTELRDRRTEDLNVRGVLSPNGGESVVPSHIWGESVVPAVQWLVDEVKLLRAKRDRRHLMGIIERLRAERDGLAAQLGEATIKAVVTGGPVVRVDDGCPNCPPGHDCERGNYATTRDSTVAEFRAGMAAQVRRDLAAEFGVALPDTTTEGAR